MSYGPASARLAEARTPVTVVALAVAIAGAPANSQTSICAPSSTTSLGGMPKNSVGGRALRARNMKSARRQPRQYFYFGKIHPCRRRRRMKKQVDRLKKTLKLQSSTIRNLQTDVLRSVAGGVATLPHTVCTCEITIGVCTSLEC